MNKLYLRILFKLWQFRRAVFYRDMADAFRRKVSIRDFLERETENCRLLKDSVGLAVLRFLAGRYASGNGGTLRELMASVAPFSDQMLLAAVDDSGDGKPGALERAADAIEFQLRSMKVLAFNLATPVLAVPLVGAISVMNAGIVAGIAQSAPPGVWTGFNAFVRSVSEFLNTYWGAALLGLVGLIAVVVYFLPRWTGPHRLKIDNLPGFALYRDYNAAVVLSAMAMMLGSGKTLRQAIDDMRANASPWLRWHLQRILNSLEDNPTDYVSAFSRGLMPVSVRARLMSLLDSSKSFDAALVVLGTSEVQRLEQNVKVSAAAVNWALTGALVSLAVVLSVGQMTIATALSREAEPSRMMQNGSR